MEQLKRLGDLLVEFLKTYDSYKVMEIVHKLQWQDVAYNRYVWLIGLPSIGYLLYKRRFKTLVLLTSTGAFLCLLKITLPAAGEEVPFDKLMTFIGGCVVLLALNLYFLLVRGD